MLFRTVAPSVKPTHLYDDIINMEYPLKTSDTGKHPRMALEERAKIFCPFAALRGYEEAIAAKQRVVVPKAELSEEKKEELDRCLRQIKEALRQGGHPVVTVIYFEREKGKEADGVYIKFTGKAVRLQESARLLQVVDRKLRLEDIRDLWCGE